MAAVTGKKMFKFVSSRDRAVEYVTRVNDAGQLTCSCPGWIFSGKRDRRECRHTKVVAAAARGKVSVIGNKVLVSKVARIEGISLPKGARTMFAAAR